MAISVKKLSRKFQYNGASLVDPDPMMTPEQVKDFYSIRYREIVNACVEGPESQGNFLVYSFRRTVGEKG